MTAKRILVIEDEQDVLDMICINLIRAGHDVTSTSTASAGKLLLQEQTFDVLLSDNRLPDGLGSALLSSLVQNPAHDQMQTILMTAGAEIDAWYDELIADGLLAKPFAMSELLALVRDLPGYRVRNSPQTRQSRKAQGNPLRD